MFISPLLSHPPLYRYPSVQVLLIPSPFSATPPPLLSSNTHTVLNTETKTTPQQINTDWAAKDTCAYDRCMASASNRKHAGRSNGAFQVADLDQKSS